MIDMMKKHLATLAAALLAGTILAFPTQLEIRKVAPVVESLIEGDLSFAVDTNRVSPADRAESHF